MHRPEHLSEDELKDPEFAEQVGHVDFDQPNIARIYDYHLGGNANFAVDREAGDAIEREWPAARDYAQHNRGFLWRAVRTLTRDYGLDQFLDLGSGVPTVGNVHEIAHQYNPAARVAYVEWESIAVHHARRMLGDDAQRVSMTQADVCDPEAVLSAPGVAGLLDFTRPVAVLALGILDITPTMGGAGLVSQYRDACVGGSALVVSNSAQLAQTDTEIAAVQRVFGDTSTPRVHFRTRDQVAGLLPGYELLDPGVVPTAAWRPDEPVTEREAERSNAYAAVGILRSGDR